MDNDGKPESPSGTAADGESKQQGPDASGPQDLLTIVAIGASAGGLDALKRFFSAMPPHPRIAFVVVVHLAPKHESLLAELLTGSTDMPVTQALDGDEVKARHIYVIPPNHYLRIEQGRLRLERTVERPTIPLPIDYFMRSLAANHQGCAAGIILTGADHDGTLGLKELKAAGGFTMAQEPATAQHPSMPQSAMAAEPDRVLPIEQMPQALVDFVDQIERAIDEQPPAAAEPDGVDPLKEVLEAVRLRTGHDFRGYRPGMLMRRFHRRQALKQLPGAKAYLQMLRHEPDEAATLAGEFLIGITEFFREPAAWQFLQDQVVPQLIQKKPEDGPIRVWSAGCASGEEAYSIAMLLLQALEPDDGAGRVTVFGTDIDPRSLKVARSGRYSTNIQVTVSPERLKRFFRKLDNGYEVRKELRESVLFAPQNLLSDPPFSRLDLIICRNLLIYLQPALQQRLIELFHFALNPGGYLFLGKSESLGAQAAQFEPVSKEWRIYRSIGMRTRLPRDLPAMAVEQPFATRGPDSREPGLTDPAAMMQRLLLDGHAPAGVLVSRDYQVVYFQGRTEQYLETPAGEPSWDLPSLAREGLRIKLRAALHRAVSEEQAVSFDGTVKRGSGLAEVRVSVEPVRDLRTSGMLLVTFHDRPAAPSDSAGETRVLDEPTAFRHLESELADTKRELQNAVESLETANEELRVGNEEAMSTNEELQSSNEELQTSKEELQSLNEELVTVNTQLEAKVEELQVANDDLNNLLSSTDIPTLFLDGNFRIKRFTSSAKLLFKLIDTDVNRQLSDIVSNMREDSLLVDARQVFDTLVPHAKEVHTFSGESYLRRILPYRTEQDRIDGVVVTFTDITELRRATERLTRVATAVRDSNDAIIVYGLDGRIADWNKGASRMYGYSEEDALGMSIEALVPPELRASEASILARARTDAISPYDTRRLTRDKGIIDVSLTLSALRDDSGQPWRLLSTERDITSRKRMEQVLRESEIRFRNLADSIPALVWMDDARQRLQYVNRGFRTFTGQQDEALLREGWLGMIHSDDVEHYLAAYDRAFRRREAFEEDFRLRRIDGKHRWMRTSGVPRFQADQEFIGFIGLVRDVHERKLAEQSLADADKRKSEFLAMLAHELRNPLAPIRTTVEVLRRVGSADAQIAWATGVIERQTHQLSGLVDELLDVARISSGKIVLHREPVDLSVAISRATETVRPLIESRSHALTVKAPAQPLYVEGDLLRLGQVFSNLLNNAAKFTPERGVIAVTLETAGNEAVVSVRDNGAGIAADMLPQVFDLFTQADSSLDRSQGGLGLGLTLVRDLVKMHGGQVEARSAGLGQGSEFSVRLPLIAAPKRSEPAREAPGKGDASLRILVGDDNVDAAESLAVLLRLVGHEVQTTHDGPGVLNIVDGFQPDVVLLDIGLPAMDGYEVARRLRARDRGESLVLIATTGYGQPQDVEHSKAAGFDHHLVKPVDSAKLLSLMASAHRDRATRKGR